MSRFTFRGIKTREISFPLGGLGTGCIGLAGNGRLIDWEIFNRPAKGMHNGFSHFAIRAESGDRILDTRILQGDLIPPYQGDYQGESFDCFGFGPSRESMAGLPHFREVEFTGEYPFAKIRFFDDRFPGLVGMEAFNPFIPLNDRDSSIPAAFFDIEVENTGREGMTYSVLASMSNPFLPGLSINKLMEKDDVSLIVLGPAHLSGDEPEYGTLCIATDSPERSFMEYWYRGGWFDKVCMYWEDINRPGKLRNRKYPDPPDGGGQMKPTNTDRKQCDMATLAVHVTVPPGEKRSARFVLAWYFPNFTNYWNPKKGDCGSSECDTAKANTWKNYYATIFTGSDATAQYSLKNWQRLRVDTLMFKDALFGSTLPEVVIDAIAANISILKTPTCLRLQDGSFWGFEGCMCKGGCCAGSCTHVWSYTYALPFLFPRLERSMRDIEYRYSLFPDGGMGFRIPLPLGREPWGAFSCVDGQFGTVIRVYREWKVSGDTEWLKGIWRGVKKSIEFAWAETNIDQWDANKDGVLEGRQHETLDMELFGPSSWLNGLYVAALKAGAEMAEHLGERGTAAEYRSLYRKGKEWMDQNLFNGEYYHQKVDLGDRSVLERYSRAQLPGGAEDTLSAYWNEEKKQLKYQIGEACGVDQVIAQWHANLCGLGEIFDRDKTRKALRSIYRYNYKKSVREHANRFRLVSLNDEGGTVILTWPRGNRPAIPPSSADEAMPGFEYPPASHLIQEGFVDMGVEMVKAIRDKYDGERRNPWNEMECGSNYARSMASYALLLAFSGLEFDMVRGIIGFNPVARDCRLFSCFWSLDSGWGVFSTDGSYAHLRVLYGSLKLKTLRLPYMRDVTAVMVGGNPVLFGWAGGKVEFKQELTVGTKGCITVVAGERGNIT